MNDDNDWRDDDVSMAEMAQRDQNWRPRDDAPAPRLDEVDRDRPSSFAMAGGPERSKSGPIVLLFLVILGFGAVVATAAFIWFSLVEPSQPPEPPPGAMRIGDL